MPTERQVEFQRARAICLEQTPPGSKFVVIAKWSIEEPRWLPLYSIIDINGYLRPFVENFTQELSPEAWDWFIDFFVDVALDRPAESPLHKTARTSLYTIVWLHGGFEGIFSETPLPMLFDGRARSCALYPIGATTSPMGPHIYATTEGALPNKQSAAVIYPGIDVGADAPSWARWARGHPMAGFSIVLLIILVFGILAMTAMYYMGRHTERRGRGPEDWLAKFSDRPLA